MDRLGVTVHEKTGTARFVDPHTIETERGLRLQADKIILCAGGMSRRLSVPGFELTATHSDAWSAAAVPPSMLVIGGGATGVQLASIFNAFGSEVQLFQAGPRILPTEDEDVSAAVAAAFRRAGIVVREVGREEGVGAACGDASPVLELGEHVLDLVALAVERFVIFQFQRLLAVFGRRDTRGGATLCQAIAEPVAVVAAIGDQRGGLWQVGQKRSGASVVADRTGGEVQQDRPSGLIADGVQLGVQTGGDRAGGVARGIVAENSSDNFGLVRRSPASLLPGAGGTMS